MAAAVITDPGESVYNFKLRVAEAARHGYKISLKWNDTVLEDDSKKLSEYGIRCGDTVALTSIYCRFHVDYYFINFFVITDRYSI